MSGLSIKDYSKSTYLLFVGLFMIFLGYTLFVKVDLASLVVDVSTLGLERKYSFLIMTIILAIINWSLEAIKWQTVMQEFTKLDFRASLRSVMVGVSVGLFTPAKVGEYVGRMVLVEKTLKAASAIATLLCSMAQMSVTLCFGILAVFALAYRLEALENISYIYLATFLILVIICFCYLMLPEILNRMTRVGYLTKWLSVVKDLYLSKKILLRLLLLASLRYAVYLIQYICIFYFLGVEHSCVEFIGYVAIVYLIQTLIPLPPIASFFGRGGIALLVFSIPGINELIILSATLLIWVINLLIPALSGIVILSKVRTPVLND